MLLAWIVLAAVGIGALVWGAETFAEHLAGASASLGVSTFALALLLAGAEPEELATSLAGSLGDAPAIALGDVIGANVAICLVALGLGALVAPLRFGPTVRRYALLSLPLAGVSVAVAWGGSVDRAGGALLATLYLAFVAVIWVAERRVPVLGELAEVAQAQERLRGGRRRVGRDLLLVGGGLAALVTGATALVAAIRGLAGAPNDQARLSLTVIGFATAFELVVLAVSAARRGATEVVAAAVIGSFAYNATMTLGAAALVRPLVIERPSVLHVPLGLMLASLVLVVLLGLRRGQIGRGGGVLLVSLYPVFLAIALLQR